MAMVSDTSDTNDTISMIYTYDTISKLAYVRTIYDTIRYLHEIER